MTAVDNQRIEDRTSLFIMATLHSAAGALPVKLRNISSTGALIEGEGMPAPGQQVELRRAAQGAVGTLVWRDGGKAGVHFDRPTNVDLWLPTAAAQHSVDTTVEFLRTVEPVPSQAPLHASYISTEDMEAVAALLDELGDTLSNDAGVLFNYGMKLQAVDIAAQMLRKLAHQSRRAQRLSSAA